jgi:hypothetical protein
MAAPHYFIPTVGTHDLQFLNTFLSLPQRVGDYVTSHTGFKPSAQFSAALSSEQLDGYLPYYKGSNILGAGQLGGHVEHFYDPKNVPRKVAELAATRRIAMKHVCTFKDGIRTLAVVFEPGMLADDSVYFYVPHEERFIEPLLAHLNSSEADRFVRYFTEKNLPQTIIKTIPCPNIQQV